MVTISSLTHILGTSPLTSDTEKTVDDLYQMRKETLLSVDDLVMEVVATLRVCR